MSSATAEWAKDDTRAIVLVEGITDRIALETLAARHGRDLDGEGVRIVPIGGAQAIGRCLARYGASGSETKLAGLCDVGEENVFRRALERAGFGSGLTRPEMEALGFHVCVRDLEDELIRAVGSTAVEALLDEHGDLHAFRTFQKQPAWRRGSLDRQLRRFLCSSGRRNVRYPRILAEAVELNRVPRPLDGVLASV
ncbi:MAG TPA: ATP-dependent endonuclease [Gaiellaceae bacterium]